MIILYILCLLCLLRIFNVEHFDDLHVNKTLSSCADLCKTTSGCYGFGHRDDACYISNTTINNYPHHSVYKDIDIDKYVICNKVHTVLFPDKNLSAFERKGNSLFICSLTRTQPRFDMDKHQILMFSDKKKFYKMDEGQNLSFLTSIEDYEVGPYAWPTSLYEAEQRKTLNQYAK